MKLFTKYSRINVLAMILIFLVSSLAFYFLLNYVLIKQLDEDLKIEQSEITNYAEKYSRLPENTSVKDQVIEYEPTGKLIPPKKIITTRSLQGQNIENEPFRQLQFGVFADQQWYRVTVSKSLEETDDLIRSILVISIFTILAILIASFIINRLVLKRIWKPFYHSLDSVKQFKVSGNQQLQFPTATIDEFNFMNQTLEGITTKAQLDYLSLKTFSENASHEIQTPIAIIRSKLDLLIQDEQLTEEHSQILLGAYKAIEKLTRLNQSLLLMARIENRQYEEVQTIDLSAMLQEKLNEFNELWESHLVNVQTSLKKCRIKMNPYLADILLNNLLSNATKHNFAGGKIRIELDENKLLILNTSYDPMLDKSKLFERFYKPSTGNDHNGLGLSIIKQICDVSGFKIDYEFADDKHGFTIIFNGKAQISL